jgi:hypothetical protein
MLRKHDASRSHKINDIRHRTGNPMTHCPTCGHGANNAYRRWSADMRTVLEGCVDAFHTGANQGGGTSNAWHVRESACALRRAELLHLESL